MVLCRAPLSIGDAYLQHQNAAYQASLGWQDAGDFLISPHMLGKHPYGGMGGAFGLPGLSEVVWPGVPGRSLRDNESGSSSEDQVRPQGFFLQLCSVDSGGADLKMSRSSPC